MKIPLQVLLQIGGVVLTAALAFLVSRQKPSKLKSILQWNSISVAVCMFSYLLEMLSINREQALIAVIFENISLAGIVICVVSFVIEYCQLKIPRWIPNTLCVCLGILELPIILTIIDGFNLHYAKYWLDRESQGFTVFKHEAGICYYLYAATIILCIALCVGVTITAMIKSKSKKLRRSYFYVFLACAPAVMFFPIKLLDLFNGYDLGPVLMTIMAICFFILTSRYKIFDLASVAKDNILQAISESIIVLNSNGEPIYCNRIAQDTFFELSRDGSNEFVASILKNERKEFTYNGNYYEWKTSGVYNGKKFEGIAICITDVTYLKKNNEQLKENLDEQSKKAREQAKKLTDNQQQIIISMAELIDGRGSGEQSGEHVKRTTSIVALVAKTLQSRGYYSNTLTTEYIDNLLKAAPLYDIGKITVPDSVLQKPGRFTNEEFELMKTHTTEGGKIIRHTLRKLDDSKFLDMAYDVATYHHEKYNGTGYPMRLSGDAIPLSARILAIADVFDELISERSYKVALPTSKAFAMIEAGKGSHFDPVVADVFISLRARIEELLGE